MQTFLPEIAGLIAGATTLPVHIGRPNAESKGVFIWPWKTSWDQAALRSSGAPTLAKNPQASAKIEVAIVVTGADAVASLTELFACGLALTNTPVLQSANEEARIVATTLSHEDLCHLFEAAEIPLTPCLTFVLSVPFKA